MAKETVEIVRCRSCAHVRQPRSNERYAARGIVKCGCTASPCYGRLVYLSDFCSYCKENTAEAPEK